MKTILIICDFFPPGFGPRMGYLVKYLSKFNYRSIILSTSTLTREDNANFSHLVGHAAKTTIINLTEKELHFYTKNQQRIKNKAIAFIKPDYNRPLGISEKMIIEGQKLINSNNIDLILCSTSGIFPLGVASVLSEKFKIPWIADIRDIIEQGLHKKLKTREKIVKIRSILRRNYLLRKADHIITISRWHKEKLSKINKNVTLIYNGFDPELYFFKEPQITSKFTITYTGTVLTVKHYQDPTLFFKAIKSLHYNNIISKNTFTINFYTYPIGINYISTLAEEYGILDFFNFSEFIPASNIPTKLHESSLLLMFAKKCEKHGPNGVLTTKLFEYIGTCRPILCVESDHAEIEEIIDHYKLGLAAKNEIQIYNYIKDLYTNWLENNFTFSITNKTESTSNFSRFEQARQFSIIFNQYINKKL